MFPKNPDFIGVFCYPNAGFFMSIFVDIKTAFSLWEGIWTPVKPNSTNIGRQVILICLPFLLPEVLKKDFGLFSFHDKGERKMYFTDTPSLNSMEAMMKKAPHTTQRGGGRNRSPYRYTKKDCDCRLCLYYRKKEGCTATVCPVLDIRRGETHPFPKTAV